MDKKVVYLALLAVLIVGIGINTSHQMFLWGFETVTGGDEFVHFARAQNIARGYVDAYHEYDNPKYFDLYPSGFPLLSAQFLVLSGFPAHFYTSLIFKSFFALMTGLFAFLIGSKINWKVGIFSSFFFLTYFQIYTWSKTFYIMVASPQNSLGSTFVSTTMIFVTLLLYLLFLKARENDWKFGILIVFLGAAHGVSHISTYIGFVLNFIAFSVIVLVISVFKYRSYLFKIINIIIYTTISIPIVFMVYYYPMFPGILSAGYFPEKFFPPFIPASVIPYLPPLSMLMLLASVSVLILYNRYVSRVDISHIRSDRKLVGTMLLAYFAMYGITLFLVTRDPYGYPGSGELILMGVFPTYIPHSYPGMISTVSLLVGFSMYALSVMGFLYAYKLKFINFNFILLLYFSFYIVWFVSAIIIKYYPSRIMYFQYVLPFLYGAGLFSLIATSKKRAGEAGHSRARFIKRLSIPRLKKYAAIGIVFMFLAMNVTSQITKEPELRPELEIERVSLGETHPPRDLSSLIYEIDYLTEPGDYILATPETLEVASATEGLRSPTSHWSQTYADHTSWAITIKAIRGTNVKDFFDTYDADYLVVGYGDIHGAAEIFGNKYHDPDIYSKNPHLLLIYVDDKGERVYAYVE